MTEVKLPRYSLRQNLECKVALAMSLDQHGTIDPQDAIGSLSESLSAIVLPIERHQRDLLLRHLNNELLSLSDLSQAILRSPVATLHVCRQAGLAARQRDIDIMTLEQACGLLGVERLRSLLRELPVIDRGQAPQQYRQLLSLSEHALAQAQGLFAQRMARLWHELSLASLLFLAPFWIMVYQRPDLFDGWDRRHLGLAASPNATPIPSDAELLELAIELAQNWWLPPWIIQGYRALSGRRTMVKALHIARNSEHPRAQQAALDDDRPLLRWLTQPANSLLMANGLALGAHHDWDARHTRRWQQLTALYLGCALDEMQSASHHNAVNHAQHNPELRSVGLWHPAEALLWPQGTRRQPRTALHSPIAARGNPELWRQRCLTLRQRPSPFANLLSALDCALDALEQGLDISRSWIALYNGRKDQLMISANRGFDAASLAGATLGSCREGQWGRWLISSDCHDLSPERLRQLAQLMPASCKALLAEHGHLLPLLHRERVIGLIHVAPANGQLDQRRRAALIKTAQSLYQALITFKQPN